MTDVIETSALIQRSLDQSSRLISSVPVDGFGDPTPCSDFAVRTLVGHMTFAAGRLAMAGRRVGRGDGVRPGGRGTRFGTRLRPVGGVPGSPTGHSVTTATGR